MDSDKIQHPTLQPDGSNYDTWVVETQDYLQSKGLEDTITEEFLNPPAPAPAPPAPAGRGRGRGQAPAQHVAPIAPEVLPARRRESAQALYFIRRHLHQDLRRHYLNINNPADLWVQLRNRFDHLKTVLRPKTEYEWLHLRFSDYKSVKEYDAKLNELVSTLRLCGEDALVTEAKMIDRTLSTFPTAFMSLSEQYRHMNLQRYTDLLQVLLRSEQRQELMMRNESLRVPGMVPPYGTSSQVAPTPSTAESHSNVTLKESTTPQTSKHPRESDGGHRSRGYGRGRGRRARSRRGQPRNANFDRKSSRKREESDDEDSSGDSTRGGCFECGLRGHYAANCRAPQYFRKLHKESVERKKQKSGVRHIESNMAASEPVSISYAYTTGSYSP